MEAKLFIRHASITLSFMNDKEGNMTSTPAAIIYYTAETSIPFSHRFQASMKVPEAKLKEIAQNLDEIPFDFLKNFSRLSRGFESIHREHFYACYNNDEEIYEQMLELFKEGVHAYFNGSYGNWQKHLCCVHDLKVGETVTLSNGYTFKVKQPARIITEPHDDPWNE